MKVITNNCVSTIAVPEKAKSGDKVAYNPVLNLFVTMDCCDGISAWNPVTGKVFNITDCGADGCLDMVLTPRNHVVMSYSEAHHGGVVYIYSLENLSESLEPEPVESSESSEPESVESSESSEPEPVLDINSSLLRTYPGKIALSPQNSLLVVDSLNDLGDYISDIFIDWDKVKVVKVGSLTNDTPLSSEEGIMIDSLCCTPDYNVVEGVRDDAYDQENNCPLLIYIYLPIRDQSNESEEQCQKNVEKKVKSEEGEESKNGKMDDDDDTDKNDVIDGGSIRTKRDTIDHCILDGLEYKLDHVTEFVHDGQNLIIADANKILLLETLTNGSNAHLIVSELPHFVEGLGINHKGQLMVCDGRDSIKIFEYKCTPRSLQGLCRCCILEAIPSNYIENVKTFSLPETMTAYLLFKDLGY